MRALIIGAARSGKAVTELLIQKGYTCTLIDLESVGDTEKWQKLGVRTFEGPHPESLWEEPFDLIIKNPGIPQANPFIQGFTSRGHFIYNEIDVAARYAPDFRYGAVTGTNGKTTTTAILGEMLKRKNPENVACGNIGTPLSEVVSEKGDRPLDIALEIAAFQLLGTPEFHPEVSVILNLTPDHLDVFGIAEAYYQAKCLVYHNQRDEDWFLKNIDDENVVRLTHDVPCKIVTFSLEKHADLMLENGWVTLFGKPLFETASLFLKGTHNVQNAMVAAAMAVKLNVDLESIRNVIREFRGVEHRLEYVDSINGVDYYNDSKATTAESTLMALKAFDQPVILLAGGYDKKTGFDPLLPVLDKIKTMVAFGVTKHQFKTLYDSAILVENMTEALNLAYLMAKEGDIVLLSPACASYDQFNNFEERGRLFKDQVRLLKNVK